MGTGTVKGLSRCQEKQSPKTKRLPKMDEECRFPQRQENY